MGSIGDFFHVLKISSRTFNCAGTADCWCLSVERSFDYEAFFIRTGHLSCVCPVCLTAKETV